MLNKQYTGKKLELDKWGIPDFQKLDKWEDTIHRVQVNIRGGGGGGGGLFCKPRGVRCFIKLFNNQKLNYILTCEDQEILQSVGRFLYENMLKLLLTN